MRNQRPLCARLSALCAVVRDLPRRGCLLRLGGNCVSVGSDPAAVTAADHPPKNRCQPPPAGLGSQPDSRWTKDVYDWDLAGNICQQTVTMADVSMEMIIRIRPEEDGDQQGIWAVNEAAFEGEAEAHLVQDLRRRGYVEVSLVAQRDGQIVGHILFSRLPIITAGRIVPAVSLAPMAVLPGYQRQGIGSRLVAAGLNACREKGHRIAIVLGHPGFYSRFGLSPELAKFLESPYSKSKAWMAAELVPGALEGVSGRVKYPPPFSALE